MSLLARLGPIENQGVQEPYVRNGEPSLGQSKKNWRGTSRKKKKPCERRWKRRPEQMKREPG